MGLGFAFMAGVAPPRAGLGAGATVRTEATVGAVGPVMTHCAARGSICAGAGSRGTRVKVRVRLRLRLRVLNAMHDSLCFHLFASDTGI